MQPMAPKSPESTAWSRRARGRPVGDFTWEDVWDFFERLEVADPVGERMQTVNAESEGRERLTPPMGHAR